MKKTITVGLLAGFLFCSLQTKAQINLKDRVLGAAQKAVAGFTFSDADAAELSKAAVTKMDAEHTVAGPTDPYSVRLNKVFAKHTKGDGYTLNYKVYKLNEVNAFATADGSVRIYSGLMDIMDDNELLAVIGHEIGHVANSDTKDAIKESYKKEALIGLAASQSQKVAAITDSQLGAIASGMIDSRHSRKQETEADEFSYNFMKNNGYNVNAVASAFSILAKMSEGTQSSFIDKMMSSHPDPKERAENAKLRAEQDGLYKPYVKQKPVAVKKAPVTSKKAVVKKKK